jgi:hypothetical protein
MKPGRKIIAACVLAASPFWLAGSVPAAPIGMALALKDAPRSDVVTVRAVGVSRVAGVGRIGAVGVGGGRWAGADWRPGYGLAAGAIVGGAIAAAQPGYGYGYNYGPDYYGYGQAYPIGPYPSGDGYGYGYDYGGSPGGDYWQSCSHVGGPKTGSWGCR